MSKKKNRKNKFGNTTKRNKVVQTPTDKNSTNKTTTVTSYNWKNAYKDPHIYKGVKNKTEFTEFVALCKLTQNELKDMLRISRKFHIFAFFRVKYFIFTTDFGRWFDGVK